MAFVALMNRQLNISALRRSDPPFSPFRFRGIQARLIGLALALGGASWSAQPQAGASPRGLDSPQEWLFFGDDFIPRARPSLEGKPKPPKVARGAELLITRTERDSEGDAWLGWGGDGGQRWIPEALAVRVAPQNRRSGNLPIGQEAVSRWQALPLDYEPDDLRPLPAEFRYEPELPYLLRAEALDKALEMFRAARAQGVRLSVVSAYRSAEKQRELCLAQVKADGFGQTAVAKPGHSEHQLGSTIDVTGPDESRLLKPSFADTDEGRWIRANACRFGFVISYTEENRVQTGYDPEPWHLRYVGVQRARDWKPVPVEGPIGAKPPRVSPRPRS